MNSPLPLLLIGVIVGIYGGVMGLGGGTIMIPIMVLALGFSQHEAVGTSLAVMIPPVALPAAIQYYRQGNVRLVPALWIAIGFVVGALVGGHIAHYLSDRALKLVFGFVLVYVAGYTIFDTLGKHHLLRSILLAALLVAISATFYSLTRYYDQSRSPVAAASAPQHPPANP